MSDPNATGPKPNTDEHMKAYPVCIYATRERARAAESAARDELAKVFEKHGVLAAVVVIGMAYRDDDGERMNVGLEGYGSTDHAHAIANDVLRAGLFT